ncbi:MAG: hypothetical protein J7K89_03840 [Candidatus Cloacimonetes bacterium]|nr:hypothetical protein [Candidatus Cloacimonadota bacterium]
MKKKLLDTGAFALFLIGSSILYSILGKWVAIGVALEVLAVYLFIYIKFIMKDDAEEESTEGKK